MSLPPVNADAVRIAAMWLLLLPLIILLGTLDTVTSGRSRRWPLGDQPQDA